MSRLNIVQESHNFAVNVVVSPLALKSADLRDGMDRIERGGGLGQLQNYFLNSNLHRIGSYFLKFFLHFEQGCVYLQWGGGRAASSQKFSIS